MIQPLEKIKHLVPFFLTILLISQITLFILFLHLKRKIHSLFPQEKGKKQDIFRKLLVIREKIEFLKTHGEELEKKYSFLERKVKTKIGRINILRYNATKDIRGDQSFSIILLDDEKNGLILSSLFLNGISQIYVKKIENGKSERKLSSEEEIILKESGI